MKTEFLRYPHLERFGHKEVEGIEKGHCYIFPKLDGSNASMWYSKSIDIFHYGSRNRELSLDKDNAKFMATMELSRYGDPYRQFLEDYPSFVLYGEWLVPHTIKNYIDFAWNKFYIFDIYCTVNNKFIPYSTYINLIRDYNLDFIPATEFVSFPTQESLHEKVLTNSKFLLKNVGENGEGIVIKNYEYSNIFNRVTWAKILVETVQNKPSVPANNKSNEELFAEKFVTPHFVEKEYNKILVALRDDGDKQWDHRCIPRLLESCYRELIVEELYNYSKKLKGPIDFKVLKTFVMQKIKEHKKELF